MCKGYKDNDNVTSYDFYSNALFEKYPQLVPFDNLKIKMHLKTSGVSDANTDKLIKELKGCNIDWVAAGGDNVPEASIGFVKKGDKYEATINVISGMNKTVVSGAKMIFKETEGAGKELALRIFGKGGSLVFEPVVVN